MGLYYKKDAATDACIFIQTKEKSPNANCDKTQSGPSDRTRGVAPEGPVSADGQTGEVPNDAGVG